MMPIQMARIRGDGSIQQVTKETLKGTQTFLEHMRPRGLAPVTAKDLMLKDSDYSTPADHYFSHLNRLKTNEEGVFERRESQILEDLGID
jgi:hypothetical protein